jgi:hypothetical protein
MRKLFEIGGLVAAVVLIAFGVGALVMGVNGRSTVRDNLAQEQISFGDAAKDPTVPKQYSGELVNTGAEARAFANMMRGHTLESTKGLTYAEMGRFEAKPGAPAKATDGQGGTNDPAYAATDPQTKQPVSNAARNIWVTETALTTALNTAYMAERVAVFGIVVGIALLLSGFGFAILAIGGALRNPDTALAFAKKLGTHKASTAPTA